MVILSTLSALPSKVPPVRLALFDLDNTLLAGDSDHSWGEFLCETGRVDAVEYRARNDAFYADYCAGKLDVVAYQSFTQAILARTEAAELARWQAEFMAEVIEPIILAKGEALLREHREAGDKLVIITATNRFITAPIAARLGVDTLLATECGMQDGRYTGIGLGIEGAGSHLPHDDIGKKAFRRHMVVQTVRSRRQKRGQCGMFAQAGMHCRL